MENTYVFKDASNKDSYPFYIYIKDNTYYCVASTDMNKLCDIKVFTKDSNNQNYVFLIISVLYADITSSISTRYRLMPIDGLSQLYSIYYIMTYMFKMLGIDKRRFMDVAKGKCNNYDSQYLLFVYRLFSTDNKGNPKYDIDDLSIYYKLFKTKDNKLTNSIKFLGDPTLQLKEKMMEIQQLTYDFDGKGTPQKITEYFKTFGELRGAKDCHKYADIIEKMHEDLISDNPLYKKFYYTMTSFEIDNKDCIYYPKDTSNVGAANAAAQPGGSRYTKKRRYHKKHRRSTRK